MKVLKLLDVIHIIIIRIIFISAFIRSAFGFGDALIAMPLLAIFIGLKIATPIVGLCAVSYSILILAKEWRKVNFKNVLVLVLTSAIGIPLGIYLLKGNYESILKIILGVLIISFSLLNIVKPKLIHLNSDKSAFLFGILSGVLGGAYNTNGPPIVFYGLLRKWDSNTLRATLQAYFLPTGFLIAVSHFLGGLWTSEVLINFLLLIPVLVLGVALGNVVHNKIEQEKFSIYIFYLLILLGAFLVFKHIF